MLLETAFLAGVVKVLLNILKISMYSWCVKAHISHLDHWFICYIFLPFLSCLNHVSMSRIIHFMKETRLECIETKDTKSFSYISVCYVLIKRPQKLSLIQ